MTDKEQIKCKYKFQDKEKFDGKTYCTCFCELCEDLPPCDDNCQIYEDFKQLTFKTQECEELKKPIQTLMGVYIKVIDNLKEENTRYRKALEEIEDITQNHIINDFSNWNMGGISDDIVADYVTANCKQILDIINKAKGAEDER